MEITKTPKPILVARIPNIQIENLSPEKMSQLFENCYRAIYNETNNEYYIIISTTHDSIDWQFEIISAIKSENNPTGFDELKEMLDKIDGKQA